MAVADVSVRGSVVGTDAPTRVSALAGPPPSISRMVTDAVVAGGALILVLILSLPNGQSLSAGSVERSRRERNARTAAVVAALATLSGSILILVPTRWPFAFPAVAGVLLCSWLVLAWQTHREYAELASKIQGVHNEYGIVPLGFAALVGIGAVEPGLEKLAEARVPDEWKEQALRRARERARWSWALCHPFGAPRDGL